MSTVSPSGRLRRRLLGLSPRAASFAVRGFHSRSAEAERTLEQHGEAFIAGYNLALESGSADDFSDRAAAVDVAERGFAFEGAAMAFALLDLLTVGRRGRRIERFLRGVGEPHVYMVHVGAGWALARLRRRSLGIRGLDPLLRWLAFDGYGFHEGFFSPDRRVRRGERPRWLSGYAARAFDQGLGRSLWFVDGADAARVARTIERFPPARQPDLWSGVGLAAAYAGAASEAELSLLPDLAGEHRLEVAQGATFAAKARRRAGNLVPHTDLACTVLAGVGAAEAATMVDQALGDIVPESDGAYEQWRSELRSRLARVAVAA